MVADWIMNISNCGSARSYVLHFDTNEKILLKINHDVDKWFAFANKNAF